MGFCCLAAWQPDAHLVTSKWPKTNNKQELSTVETVVTTESTTLRTALEQTNKRTSPVPTLTVENVNGDVGRLSAGRSASVVPLTHRRRRTDMKKGDTKIIRCNHLQSTVKNKTLPTFAQDERDNYYLRLGRWRALGAIWTTSPWLSVPSLVISRHAVNPARLATTMDNKKRENK